MGSDIRAQLRQVPLFSGLDDAALQLLADSCRRRQFPAKEALFHEGDPGQTLYIILSGRVNIERITAAGDTVHIVQRGPGEHIGELALLDDAPRSADAVTDGPSELLVLHRQTFLQCLGDHPSITLNIIRSLVLRLRQAIDQSTQNETLDVMGRLAVFLLKAAAAGVKDPDGGLRLARITDEQIAQQIGATREHVNRQLARLKQRGILRRAGRVLVVMQQQKLRDLCDR